jgi:hypothetical protein
MLPAPVHVRLIKAIINPETGLPQSSAVRQALGRFYSVAQIINTDYNKNKLAFTFHLGLAKCK